MIDLGLARIGRLLQQAPAPAWKAVHVAGTNGKGSVCAYVSALLQGRGMRVARFTSPHLVDRWDCVVLDERVVGEAVFRAAEKTVRQRDAATATGATEFELLTATAFEVFGGWATVAATAPTVTTATTATTAVETQKPRPPAPLAVVECGLGGSLDATTAMRAARVVTVVTRIGVDHEGLLGRSAAAIATHKAGIMRRGVPCVVDAANRADAAVRGVLEAQAAAVGAPLVYAEPQMLFGGGGRPDSLTNRTSPGDGSSSSNSSQSRLRSRLDQLEPHQLGNLACAYAAFRIATGQDIADGELSSAGRTAPSDDDAALLATVVQTVRWPGRLQTLDVAPLLRAAHGGSVSPPVSPLVAAAPVPVLLDGAHNPQSADVLAAYVDKHLRGGGDDDDDATAPTRPVTWILAASHGKDLDGMLRLLLRRGDRVAAVTFGAVDGMPWVRPAAPRAILDAATRLGAETATGLPVAYQSGPDADGRQHDPGCLVAALRWATADAAAGPVVIAGSLYLVSETLRQLRQAGGETGLL